MFYNRKYYDAGKYLLKEQNGQIQVKSKGELKKIILSSG